MINTPNHYAEKASDNSSYRRKYDSYEEQYDGKAGSAIDIIWDIARHEQDDEKPHEASESPDHRAYASRL